jgi:beta-lactamase regulating signal transducer with metallopeptidase domain/predicted  nucleic acid-binding Zn-ribbon protein
MTALLLFKASVLLLGTLLAVFLLRRRSAASRHRLWTLAFAALLALPLLPFALPAIDVPMPAVFHTMSPAPRVGSSPAAHASLEARASRAAQPTPRPAADRGKSGHAGVVRLAETTVGAANQPATGVPSIAWIYPLLFGVWLAGAGIAAGALALSLLRVRRLARAAAEIADPAWRQAADALGVRLGLSRSARLLTSADVTTPMAAGLVQPTIFLPASASGWSAECRDIVLAHEIAHLAVRDPLRHVTARLAVSCYWFHPLAWMAARQGMLAREQACDEAVLALGTRPSTYARILLDLAGSLPAGMAAHGALPMVQRSLLETRLMAILNDARPAMARRAALPVVSMALLTCTVAAARPGSPTLTNVGANVAAASAMDTASPVDTASSIDAAATTTEPAAAPAVPSHESPEPRVSGAALEAQAGGDSACGWDRWVSSSGGRVSMNTSSSGSERQVTGQVGNDRVIQQTFGDLRLCMVGEGMGSDDWALRPSQWVGSARRVLLESRHGNAVQRLEVVRRGGDQQTIWQVGGATRPFDAAAQQWRDRTLAALDTSWQISSLRGEVSSLRGQISSVRGQESSLRGEISSLRGQVSSMQGRASSVRGEESSLRGQISSIQGHVSSLRGQISSERGQISSVQAAASIDDPVIRERVAARIAKHNEEIARIEREIRDYGMDARIAAVEKEIAALAAARKVAAIDAQIGAFNLDGQIAAVERRIVELDVAGKVSAIERQIEALDADRKVRQLEERRDGELREVERAITALR